jgi:membrane dipeptidase
MTADTSPSNALHRDALCLDAAAPFISPYRVGRFMDLLQSGGVNAVLATVASIEDCRTATSLLGSWIEVERSNRWPIRLCSTVSEIRAAKHSGKLAIVRHLQGTDPIENDVDLTDAFHSLGVRVFQLTYNARNLVGDGCLESGNTGLSDFGRKVVRRICDLHGVVDISHVGERTSLEAIDLADGQVVATHANTRAVCNSPRNLTDEQIRAVVTAGGVIGLVAFPAFVTDDPEPTLDHLLRHADYLSALVGPEHVGLGFDFSQSDEDSYAFYGYDERYYPRPPWTYPLGIRDWSDTPNVTAALQARGYSESEIRGILGENFLRAFERIWGG